MGRKSKIDNLVSLASALSDKQREELVNKILELMGEVNNPENKELSLSLGCNKMVDNALSGNPDCPHCGAKAKDFYITKKGFDKGVQRYYCKNCGKRFVATTNTTFARTRKSANVWKKFIELTLLSRPLKECAYQCELSIQTAFTWRHKILNTFKVHQENMLMGGEIQIDELLIPLSYKGNHAKGFHSKDNRYSVGERNMPRKAFRRGTDNKPKSSKERACVFCMVQNNNKGYYAAVPGVGFMSKEMLDNTLGRHAIREESLILADSYSITANYLEENNYDYDILRSNTSKNSHAHKPEIKDGKHLQNVNAMHSHLRTFLATYRGVSSKHLEGYMAMFAWIKNAVAKKKKTKLNSLTIERTSMSDCYISRSDIEALPAVPMVA